MSKKSNNNEDINRSINSNSNNAITDRLLSSMSVSSRERPRLKPKKSMDIESHCAEVYGCGSDEDDYDYKNENNNNKSSNNNNNGNNIDNSYHRLNKNGGYGYGYGHDFDSDDDSFAEADSDCEPDQNYLDEMLEEIHPEYINLFEYKKKEQQQYRDYDQVCAQDQYNENHVDVDDENENDYIVNNGKSSAIGRLDVDVNNNVDNGHENNSSINRKYRTKTKEEDSEDEKEDDTFDSSSTNSKEKRRYKTKQNFGSSAAATTTATGRPLLRQPSCKAVWGK